MACDSVGLILYVFCFHIYSLHFGRVSSVPGIVPVFQSVSLINETFYRSQNSVFLKMYVEIKGKHLHDGMEVRMSSIAGKFGSECFLSDKSDIIDSQHFSKVWSNRTHAVISFNVQYVPSFFNLPVFICVKSSLRTSVNNSNTIDSEVTKWIHQGEILFRTNRISLPGQHISRTGAQNLKWGSSAVSEVEPGTISESDTGALRSRRNGNSESEFGSVRAVSQLPPSVVEAPPAPILPSDDVILYGMRLESAESPAEYDEAGVPELLAGTKATFRLFGSGWTNQTVFALTASSGHRNGYCEHPKDEVAKVQLEDSETSVLITIKVPEDAGLTLYFCSKDLSMHNRTMNSVWKHLGSEKFIALRTYQKLIPLWLAIIIILVCLSFSCLFSGLNLGLMSLNRTDLKIICNTGTDAERRYARAIYPVREHGNFLLCSILLGNVMVNSTFTILMDDLTSGLVAVITSTLAIVIFGEISPQAVCSRHGLAIGAKTICITKVVMVLTFPLSFPISKILDWCLGEEIGNVYTRERLKELVKVTTEYNDLEKDEVNIISGALELRRKMVSDVMTKIEDVYMLPIEAVLNFQTVTEIMKSGYSRIPVYEGDRKQVTSMLYIKDLALVDPDDCTPLRTLTQFYQNSCYFVFEDTTLDVLLKSFKEGNKGHMAFVQRVNNEGEGDPFYETIGLVTLEDVIEELIQAEINDETDVYVDNRSKRRREKRHNPRQDFTAFVQRNENQRFFISPQLNLATFQFLSSSVDPFKPDIISETILMRMLKQDVFFKITINTKDITKDDLSTYIYQQGKPADYFILILEGRVEATVGRENLIFESGPFTYFGTQALQQNIGLGAESPTNNVSQPLGSLQSVNLDSMLRYTFVPDYSVRAVTDVCYARIKRSLYLAAKRATLMEQSKKGSVTDNFNDEVDKLLAGEDDSKSQSSPEMTRNTSQLDELNGQFNDFSPTQHQHKQNSTKSSSLISPVCPRSKIDGIEIASLEEQENLLDHRSNCQEETGVS
ncbi:unextended protein isoform X2 [Bemisia tabaci]|uniref:unextended protein isoform X2 n=1 Tax=Bemisia tabaci TaxID=7038 RepID=UPI003B27BDB0